MPVWKWPVRISPKCRLKRSGIGSGECKVSCACTPSAYTHSIHPHQGQPSTGCAFPSAPIRMFANYPAGEKARSLRLKFGEREPQPSSEHALIGDMLKDIRQRAATPLSQTASACWMLTPNSTRKSQSSGTN